MSQTDPNIVNVEIGTFAVSGGAQALMSGVCLSEALTTAPDGSIAAGAKKAAADGGVRFVNPNSYWVFVAVLAQDSDTMQGGNQHLLKPGEDIVLSCASGSHTAARRAFKTT